MKSSMPFTSACSSRLSTGSLRHSRSSCALGRRLALVARGDLQQPLGGVRAPVEDHVLDQLAQRRVDLLVDRQLAGIHDAHVHAGRIAWYRNTECIASRTGSLPRNENDTLLTPPLTSACGSVALICRVASMKATP